MPDPRRRSADDDILFDPSTVEVTPDISPADREVFTGADILGAAGPGAVRGRVIDAGPAFEIVGDPDPVARRASRASADSTIDGMTFDPSGESALPSSDPVRAVESETRATQLRAMGRELEAGQRKEQARAAALARIRAGAPETADLERPISLGESVARGAVRSVPIFGSHADEAVGVGETIGDVLTGDARLSDVPSRYVQHRDESRTNFARSEAENPDASFGGEALGVGAQMLMGAAPVGRFIGAAPRALGLTGRLARGTGVAAGIGGLTAEGASDAPLLSAETGLDTLAGMGWGAALNLPIQGGAEGLRWLTNRNLPGAAARLARESGEAMAALQGGPEQAARARALLADTSEAQALRRAAVASEQDLEGLGLRAAEEHGRLLHGADEALGGMTHDTAKVRELTRRFAASPASPQAAERTFADLAAVREDLQNYTSEAWPGPLRTKSKEAIMVMDRLANGMAELDMSTPEGQAAAFAMTDAAKRQIGRAYSQIRRMAGADRAGMTLPSSSPHRAFEQNYARLQDNLQDAELWGEGATSLQRTVNPAWTEYIPHAERTNELVTQGLERSGGGGFGMESVADPRGWARIARESGDPLGSMDREGLRRGFRSAANLATTLDNAYNGGNRQVATGTMREASDALAGLLNEMEVTGAARQQLAELRNVSIPGISGLNLERAIRLMAEQEAIAAGVTSGNAAADQIRGVGPAALAAAEKSAAMMDRIRGRLASNVPFQRAELDALIHGISRVFADRDSEAASSAAPPGRIDLFAAPEAAPAEDAPVTETPTEAPSEDAPPVPRIRRRQRIDLFQ